ncbi:unnamed protein product [Closterium sp. NIES-53]
MGGRGGEGGGGRGKKWGKGGKGRAKGGKEGEEEEKWGKGGERGGKGGEGGERGKIIWEGLDTNTLAFNSTTNAATWQLLSSSLCAPHRIQPDVEVHGLPMPQHRHAGGLPHRLERHEVVKGEALPLAERDWRERGREGREGRNEREMISTACLERHELVEGQMLPLAERDWGGRGGGNGGEGETGKFP